jgi:hypothetical protein
MPERRYRDDEVRRILELATRPESEALARPESTADGLTLAEIRGIAAEVGVAPEAVNSAALALDDDARAPARRSFGLPIEVRRTIPLPRALTDREWERLVAELRATFGARGRLLAHGALREWTNGNLHACVEPEGDHWRLRLGTVKGDAPGWNALGAAGLVSAGALTVVGVLAGGGLGAFVAPAILGSAGTVAVVANLVRLPRWAGLRRRQMEHIEARVRAMMDDGATGALPP